MAMVWQRLDCSGGELILALSLADIADDSGDRIYPSISYLADKTRQSDRQVQRQLKAFRKKGWLQCKKVSTGGSGKTTRYRINPVWINGDILSGFEDREPRHLRHETVTFATETVTSMSPNPSVSINNKEGARAIPKGSRADEEARKKKIRETIHDLRLVSYGRDPKVIAMNAGCTPEEAAEVLAEVA